MSVISKNTEVRQRGLYEKEKLIDAVTSVLDGEMTSVFASNFYNVPQGTIRTHMNNVQLGIGAGRRAYLNEEKEAYLVGLIKSLEIIGVRLTKSVLKKVMGEYITRVSDNYRFKSK
jgi:hypothetical protein